MEYYLGVAKEEGVTELELGAVQAVVMAVSAGRVGAQVREVMARESACRNTVACGEGQVK
jgi:hypothetical protein